MKNQIQEICVAVTIEMLQWLKTIGNTKYNIDEKNHSGYSSFGVTEAL